MSKAIIISADEIKKQLPSYDPEHSDLVHKESTRRADKLFEQTLKDSSYEQVILMSGGAASGKTEFVATYLSDRPVIIYDGTLPSLEGARIKTRHARKYGKEVTVVAIWPQDLRVAFTAFLQRDRKYPDKHFYQTHARSRQALLDIARSDLSVDIDLYENTYDNGQLTFYEYVFDGRHHLIEKLQDNQYTEQEIIGIVTSHA